MRDQERIFCDEYLIDLNATQAALRAGYRPATAKNASLWIDAEKPQKPKLRRYIDEALAARSRRTGISQDRVVRELARIAFGDPLAVIDADTGGLQKAIDREDRAMIAGYRVRRSTSEGGETEEYEVRLTDRAKALELLGRHLGMFTDQVHVEMQQMPKIFAATDGSVEIGGEAE